MPRLRDIPRQQIEKPALQPSTQSETFEELEWLELDRTGIKMPEFIHSDPELWFSILDKTFKEIWITSDSRKFTHALTAIGPNYSIEVCDIILNPPEDCAFEILKSELIKRISLSQEEKTRPFEHEELGDHKPSQFLHLRNLGNAVGDNFLWTVW